MQLLTLSVLPKNVWRVACFSALCLLTACTTPPSTPVAQEPRVAPSTPKKPAKKVALPFKKANAFSVYYGQDLKTLTHLTHHAKQGQLIVIDARKIPPRQLGSLSKSATWNGAKVIAYLSIGELDSRERERFDSFVRSLPPSEQKPFDELALEWNDKFKSWRIDVSHPMWQQWVKAELKGLMELGVQGIFLDTPDTVDRYITYPQWGHKQRAYKVEVMIQLIRSVKLDYPEAFVILNRGLNLVGEKVWMNEDGSEWMNGLALMSASPGNPDAVLYENAFAANDPWTERIEADLHATRNAGHTVVLALGYQDVIIDKQAFAQRCVTEGFLCAWAHSSETLHKTGSQIIK